MHPALAALGLPYPIFQAPMAGVSTPALAAAVSRAGGLGALGLGASTAESAKAQLIEARSLGARRLHANGFCHPAPARDAGREHAWIQHFEGAFRDRGAAPPETLTPPYVPFQDDDALLAVLLEAKPEVASFHFGLPREHQLRALHRAGILTLVSVTCAEDGQAALDAGVGGLIAQGMEAGGHRSTFLRERDEGLGTAALLARLRPLTQRPLIAAGGVMTGLDLKALLKAGADAVQLGTAFLLCPEAGTARAYRARLNAHVAALQHSGNPADPEAGTVLTATLSGRPARGLRNEITARADHPTAPPPPPYPLTYDLTKRLAALPTPNAAEAFSACWAGTGVGQLRALPAADLVETLAREADL